LLSRNQADVAQLSQDLGRVDGPVRSLSRDVPLRAHPQGI